MTVFSMTSTRMYKARNQWRGVITHTKQIWTDTIDYELQADTITTQDRIMHGTALPHTVIHVFTDTYEHLTCSDDNGYWQAPLPKLDADSEIWVQVLAPGPELLELIETIIIANLNAASPVSIDGKPHPHHLRQCEPGGIGSAEAA
jgi:hypothetical protein